VKLHQILDKRESTEWRHGFYETKKRGKEEHPEGGVSRKKKTHNRTSAKICTDRTGEESRVRG
jgi:DNA polymerase II large subunit